MSEESKTADGDYVMMGGTRQGLRGHGSGGGKINVDDPTLTQEEKDHRLAIALQQQENSAAYDAHKKKHDETVRANTNRTARSGTYTKLAHVRSKDHGMLSVPSEYTSENAYKNGGGDAYVPPGGLKPPKNAKPQEVADFTLAAELQKVEQVDAGTVQNMSKIVKEDESEEHSKQRRTGRSTHHLNQKGFGHA